MLGSFSVQSQYRINCSEVFVDEIRDMTIVEDEYSRAMLGKQPGKGSGQSVPNRKFDFREQRRQLSNRLVASITPNPSFMARSLSEIAPIVAAIGLFAEIEEEVAEAREKAKSISSSSSPTVTPTPPPPTATPTPAITQPAPSSTSTYTAKKGVAIHFAKKLAKQHKVEIASVVGIGLFWPNYAADVKAAAGIVKPIKPVAVEPTSVATAPPKPSAAAPPLLPGSTVVPFTTMQAAISNNMIEVSRCQLSGSATRLIVTPSTPFMRR
ncbi:hypothetical protein ACFX1X_033752 [Malus domestica]